MRLGSSSEKRCNIDGKCFRIFKLFLMALIKFLCLTVRY
jgi:hypothetical protein